MNANHVYIIIGVAALSALISTVTLYLLGVESTAAVAGATGGSTAAVAAVMFRKNKKKSE